MNLVKVEDVLLKVKRIILKNINQQTSNRK